MKIYSMPTGILDANAHLIIDDESKEAAIFDVGGFDENLKTLLSKIEIEDLKYIILTHCHYDHIGGAEELRRLTDAKVYIGELDSEGIYSQSASLARGFCANLNACRDFETLKEGDILHLGNKSIEVIETPGHTIGSLCFIIDDEILVSGDTIFHCEIGRTDLPTGSMSDMKNSLRKIKKYEKDYKILTGHGASTTLDFEKNHNPYMQGI